MTHRYYMVANGETLPLGSWYPMPHGPMIAILKNYSPEYGEHAATVMEADGTMLHYIKGPVMQLLVGMVMLAREQLEGMLTGSLGGRAVQNRSHTLEVVLAMMGGHTSIISTAQGGYLVRDPTDQFTVHISNTGRIHSVEGPEEIDDRSPLTFLKLSALGPPSYFDPGMVGLNHWAWRIAAWRLGGDHSLFTHYEKKSWDEVKTLGH